MFEFKIDNEVSLSLVRESFAARYVELADENYEYLSRWLEWPRVCKTEADFKNFVRNSITKYESGNSMTCAIFYKGEIVGNCSFNNINHATKCAEVGYWLAAKYQGNGVITRVCQFLIGYAFNKLKVQKVQLSVAENNQPSRAVAERLGMHLEGIITNQEKVGDIILNHAIYGIYKQKT